MKHVAVVAGLFLATAASAQAVRPAPLDGSALFQERCATCHGPDGKSKTKMGEKMGAPDLTQTKASVADIQKTILEGRGRMMAYKGKIPDEQIGMLAKYVKALGSPKK